MASLSVSPRTSLVAGPLGTLPRFGETSCAQDAVVARTSSINVHNLSMPRALPLEGPTLSELALANIRLFPRCLLILILCIVFSFSEVRYLLFCTCVIKLGNPSDLRSAPHVHRWVHRSIAARGSRPRLQFRGPRPARGRNRRGRRVVFPAAPMRSGQGGRAPQRFLVDRPAEAT